MKIRVKEPLTGFWIDHHLPVVVDHFCNHAGAENITDYITSQVSGVFEPHEVTSRQELLQCRCGAWCFADMPDRWFDEYMKLERINRTNSNQLVLR